MGNLSRKYYPEVIGYSSSIDIIKDEMSTFFEEKEKIKLKIEESQILFSNNINKEENKKIQIFISTETGKTIDLDVNPSDSVRSVKYKIYDKEDIPLLFQQILIFEGKELEDNKTLKEYNIRDKNHLQLSLKGKGIEPIDIIKKEKIKIFKEGKEEEMKEDNKEDDEEKENVENNKVRILILTLDEKQFYLDAILSDTIEEIKYKIQEREGIPIDRQRIVLNNIELKNNVTLKDYRIKDKTILRLFELIRKNNENNKMRILVKSVTNKIIYLNVNPLEKIEEVKDKIQDLEGIPREQQRLVFSGRYLEDNKTLEDYDIMEEFTLHLILKQNEFEPIHSIDNEKLQFLDEEKNDGKKAEENKYNKKDKNEELFLEIANKNENKGEIKDINEIIINKEYNNNPFDKTSKTKKKDENNSYSINISGAQHKNIIKPNNLIKEISMEEKNISPSNNIIKEKDQIFIEPEKNEINDEKKDEFIKKYLKRNELNINLIYFDLNMTNKENYIIFNNFKVDVVGGFYAIDDLNILENYLKKINDKNIPFIVLSSGTSGKDVISICRKYSFVKEVIIFCRSYIHNEHYLYEYPGYVKQIFTNIKSVYNYIKTFEREQYKDGIEKYLDEEKYIFSSDEIRMDKQLQLCPLISSYEYDKCYFLVHKIYSHFFGNINNKYEESMFKKENLNKIINYLNEIKFEDENERTILINKFNKLVEFKDNDIFIEKAIREYTSESNFCYLFNRVMRNFEKGLISFAYFMGPFLYGLNKYVKDNPTFAISKKM